MLSFWEQQQFTTRDVVVIGAGITGLSTALSLKEARPDLEVLVLERSVLPSGASTKNAGFACVGSPTELLEDIASIGVEATAALVGRRFRGLQKTLGRLGAEGMGLEQAPGYELLPPELEGALGEIDALNSALRPLFGEDPFRLAPDAPRRFGFNQASVPFAVQLTQEAGINTGLMMRNLLRLARAKDIEVWTGADVLHLEDEGDRARIQLQDFSLSARHVAVCTNAFTRQLLPSIAVTPGRGQVLITEPIDDLPFEGIFHMERGYVYFRAIDGRVLLGGARHLDVAGETSTAFQLNPSIQSTLDTLLRDVILPGRPHKIAHRWTGIMGFGPTRAPVVRTVSPRLSIGVRMGGMGVALGSLVGEELAGLTLSGL